MSSSAARPFLPTFGRSTRRSESCRTASGKGESAQDLRQAASGAIRSYVGTWPSDSPRDEVLISLICGGNTEALATLFRRYAHIVRGVAHRVLRDASEADDLLQDVFLLVHRLCGTFDSSKGSARCWILQMAYRRAISRRRYLTSRHFYTYLDLDQAANQLGDTNAAYGRPEALMAEAVDRKEALQNWFAELSESQRQTLQLFFHEGYTFEEIATKLGQTAGNARNHYYRGLEKLRKQMATGKLSGKEAAWQKTLAWERVRCGQ